jgi:hypothetical protein
MLGDHIRAAISAAHTLAALDGLAGDTWRAWGSGAIDDARAADLAAAIEARRASVRPVDTIAARAPFVARLAASAFPPRKRRPVSPDRAESLARRRRLAASGPMPPALAARFTVGELASLRIVADECRASGRCERTIGEIAARAGVGVSTARNGLRMAAALGLVLIVERRRRGAPNLPNVVRIVSPEWRAWIARRPRNGGGFKNSNPTETLILRKVASAAPVPVLRRSGSGEKRTADERAAPA